MTAPGAILGLAGLLAALAGPLAGGSEPIVLEDLRGHSVRIEAARAPGAIVLHFWATWCPSCVEEFASIESVAQGTCADRVRIVAVNVGDPIDAIEAFLEGETTTLEVLRDPRGAVFRRLVGGGLPANLVRSGAQGWSVRGPLSESGWLELLTRLGCPG